MFRRTRKIKNITQEIEYEHFPPDLREYIVDLSGTDGVKRQKAREALVKRGDVVIRYMDVLTLSNVKTLRWEVAKTLQNIANSNAVPLLIKMLEDEDGDVRWVAANGLINCGDLAVKPLLEALLGKPNSFYLLKGCRLVMNTLDNEVLKEKLKPVIMALKKRKHQKEHILTEAKKALAELD